MKKSNKGFILFITAVCVMPAMTSCSSNESYSVTVEDYFQLLNTQPKDSYKAEKEVEIKLNSSSEYKTGLLLNGEAIENKTYESDNYVTYHFTMPNEDIILQTLKNEWINNKEEYTKTILFIYTKNDYETKLTLPTRDLGGKYEYTMNSTSFLNFILFNNIHLSSSSCSKIYIHIFFILFCCNLKIEY